MSITEFVNYLYRDGLRNDKSGDIYLLGCFFVFSSETKMPANIRKNVTASDAPDVTSMPM